ncbi:hypothetical protein BSKO_04562 [Bryopsis sp. KO-2023]|nr:hypothetical protein BSKO_04562 [Bryopsis sp. KO-2023]
MAALALAELVEKNASTQQAVVREGAIPHLVLQLDDEDNECRKEAAHALANLTFRNGNLWGGTEDDFQGRGHSTSGQSSQIQTAKRTEACRSCSRQPFTLG